MLPGAKIWGADLLQLSKAMTGVHIIVLSYMRLSSCRAREVNTQSANTMREVTQGRHAESRVHATRSQDPNGQLDLFESICLDFDG